jgi:hypothetical protein
VLTLVAGFVGAFIWIFEDQMGVIEVESVLLQVRLPLCLIPDEHNLIVDTINLKHKHIRRENSAHIQPGILHGMIGSVGYNPHVSYPRIAWAMWTHQGDALSHV